MHVVIVMNIKIKLKYNYYYMSIYIHIYRIWSIWNLWMHVYSNCDKYSCSSVSLNVAIVIHIFLFKIILLILHSDLANNYIYTYGYIYDIKNNNNERMTGCVFKKNIIMKFQHAFSIRCMISWYIYVYIYLDIFIGVRNILKWQK